MSITIQNTKNNKTGYEVAKMLLDIKAVNFRPDEPYILTSAWSSPVYIDCRKIISYPKERSKIMEIAVTMFNENIGFEKIDFIAGGETAGIPYAAWISYITKKPMLYVRKKPKGFGRNAQIEGDIKKNSRVLLVEDLATDGASKVLFIEALRKAEAIVKDTFVIFFYSVFPDALKTLKDVGINLHYLATWHDVLKVAEAGQYFPEETIDEVRRFLVSPEIWSKENGGKAD